MPVPFKSSCYDQMNTYAFHVEKNLKKVFAFLAGTEPEYTRNALNGIASFAVKQVLTGGESVESLRDACASLPTLSSPCVESVIAGFFEFGKPQEEYVRAAEFCTLAGDLAPACIDGFIRTLSGLYTPVFRDEACEYLGRAMGRDMGERCEWDENRQSTV